MLAIGLFAAIVVVLVMQVQQYIEDSDTPNISTTGVSDTVSHVENFKCESWGEYVDIHIVK